MTLRVCLNTPTVAIIENGKRIITVPSGAILTIRNESEDGKMTEVLWADQPIRMFTVDLKDRGDVINAAAADSWMSHTDELKRRPEIPQGKHRNARFHSMRQFRRARILE